MNNNHFKNQVVASQARMETEITSLRRDLLGNGQPGRVQRNEAKQIELEKRHTKLAKRVTLARGAIWVLITYGVAMAALATWVFAAAKNGGK